MYRAKPEKLVGQRGVEPLTSRLSGGRSNQLSYWPNPRQEQSSNGGDWGTGDPVQVVAEDASRTITACTDESGRRFPPPGATRGRPLGGPDYPLERR